MTDTPKTVATMTADLREFLDDTYKKYNAVMAMGDQASDADRFDEVGKLLYVKAEGMLIVCQDLEALMSRF